MLNYWLYHFLDWLFGDRPNWSILSFFTIFIIYLVYLGTTGFFLGLLTMLAPPLAWKYLYKER